MKRTRTMWTILLVLLVFAGGCRNGRTIPAQPNTTNADAAGDQASALATQAANVIADQADEAATRAAATVVAQTDALATQAANVMAKEGEALATQAVDLLEQGETALENGSLPASIDPGSLAAKFASAPIPNGDGTVEITVTEAELNQAIATAQAQASTPSPIQNPQVSLSNGYIILTGTIEQPINGQLTVSFSPYVVNGTLQFEVVEATIGSFQVPPAALQTAEATLNNSLGTATGYLPEGTGLQSVSVGNGSMTAVVVRQ